MINDTLTDMTVETLHDLAVFSIKATRDAAFDQGKYSQGAKIAGEIKTFAKLRCQLVKRRAGDGNAYEVVISSGGLNVKAEPMPVDGPTVTVDPQLPEHLRAQPSKPYNETESGRMDRLHAVVSSDVMTEYDAKFARSLLGQYQRNRGHLSERQWPYVDKFLREYEAPQGSKAPSIEERVKSGEPVSITEMIDDIKAKKAAADIDPFVGRQKADAGKIPAFLDRTVKGHGDLDF